MAGRQDEAVAVRPDRVGGIEIEQLLPQPIGDRRNAHRGAWMAGIGFLNGVNRQRSDRIDGDPI